MKKLFSFLLLGLLCSIGTSWADPTLPANATPTATFDAEVGESNLYAITNAVHNNKQYFVYDFDTIRTTMKAGTISWVAGPKNDGGNSASISFATADAETNYGFNATWGRAWGINNSRYVGIRVKHCSEFSALTKSNSTKDGKTLYVQVFKKNGGAWDFVESIGETTYNNSAFYVVTASLDADEEYVILLTSGNSSNCLTPQIRFASGVLCSNPEASLAAKRSAFVIAPEASDTTQLVFASSNTNSVSYSVKKDDAATADASVSDGIFTATAAGTYVVTATQAKDATYCEVEEEVIITVIESTPVISASIDGPDAGYEYNDFTYTATAANASTYTWYVDDVIQVGQTSSAFTYTGVKGNHSIYCTASNAYTATPVQSNTINLSVAGYFGDIIEYTMETASGNIDKDITAGGLVGATGHQKSQKNGKLGSNGNYLCFTLNYGTFKEGDTVKISVTPEYNSEKKTYSHPSTLKLSSNLGNTDFIGEATLPVDASSSATVIFQIVLTKGVSTIYLSRNDVFGQNPIVASVVVTRPLPEKSRSAASLSNAKINNVALAEADLNTLKSSHSFASVSEYVTAPEVKFFTAVTVIYEDDSQKVLNDSIVVNATEDPAGTWKAQAEIEEVTYTITAVKPVSYTITYMDGELELGTEVVEANAHPAGYTAYQNPELASFDGWYSDEGLNTAVADMSAETITDDVTYYAKYIKRYATSINIEQLVLDNGKGYGIIAQLGTQHYSSNITGSLDSLDVKTDGKRNYAYLGLKVKLSGALLNFRVAKNDKVKVKFGNIATTPQVSINGGAYADMDITDKVYTYTATVDALLSIKTMNADAVVFKQIVIGADPELAEVNLPLKLGANGWATFAADYKFTIPGVTIYKAAVNANKDAVILTEVENAVVPDSQGIIIKGDEGEIVYIHASDAEPSDFSGNELVGKVKEVSTLDNSYILATVESVTAFHPYTGEKMPANKAYITIVGAPSSSAPVRIAFGENNATSVEELGASDEVQKFMQDGKLFIIRNGVVYDAMGKMVK